MPSMLEREGLERVIAIEIVSRECECELSARAAAGEGARVGTGR